MLTNTFYLDFNVTGDERKRLVSAISDYMEADARYLGAPTFAFQVDFFTIDRNGCVSFDDRSDSEVIEGLIEYLANRGFVSQISNLGREEDDDSAPVAPTEAPVSGEPEPVEPVSLAVRVPMEGHTGATLRNLLNLIYTRAGLLNKALGTGFHVEEGLKDVLQSPDSTRSVESFLRAIADYGDEHSASIEGLTLTPDAITFMSLPETADTDVQRAFTELVGMMNRQALTQKRIQAKAVDDANEKYALRIWLTRLGMNGPEYKAVRKTLMRNLSGDCAFRTDAERERWTQRQAEKRAAAGAE